MKWLIKTGKHFLDLEVFNTTAVMACWRMYITPWVLKPAHQPLPLVGLEDYINHRV